MKFSYLYIIFFFLINHLQSDDLKIYNIGFLDIKEDMRYSKWGIHPVDIRSKLNKEKRPIQGALLAIEDSEKFTRLTKTKFLIEHITKKNYEDAINFLNSKNVEKFETILLDLNIESLKYFKDILKNNPKTIFFNISDPNNDIRKNICLDNFFNTYPSNAMYTDSIAQYLVKKKAQKSLLLTGPLVEDEKISSSFKESARKFGIKIYKEKFFVNNNDPRVRDKNNLFYLTKGKKYNNVFISDTDGEFALGVPNATMTPAIVTGSAGLIAKAWHWSYLRHGAPQLNGRFERMNNRRMESKDWAAWISIKTIVESILRTQNISNKNIIEYLKGPDLQVDGSKGIGLNFKKTTNQLRQTILLISSNNWTTKVAPLEEFNDSENNLNTLGLSYNQTECKLEE